MHTSSRDRNRIVPLLILATLVLAPVPGAVAKEVGKARIGFLALDSGGCRNEPFLTGLRELGYVEGQNIVIECRHGDGRLASLNAAAVELVRAKPDVLVALGHPHALAAQRATKNIPIVMMASGEPTVAGLIESFARPGGNITGLSYFNTELNIKRLELLKAVMPKLSRLAVFVDPNMPADLNKSYMRDATQAGKTLGFQVHFVEAAATADLDRAFDEMVKAKVGAVFVTPKFTNADEMKRTAELALRLRLPTMHFYKGFPKAGGLMSYGVDYPMLHRRLATHVDKILKGAKPAELPVEQTMRFELVVNLKTAKALGITIPPELLLRADEVIR